MAVGISSGVQTFVGAAHGASASSLKGIILQRGMVISLLTCFLPLLLWTQAPALLALLGQNPALADGAARYIWHVCPALLLAAVSYSVSNYLSAQRVVWPLALAMAASVGATPGLLVVFVDRLGWGLAGAAATVLCMYVLEVLLLLAVAVWHNHR